MSIYLNAGGHGLPSADTRARVLAHAEAELAADTQTAAETARAEAVALHAGAARLLGADPAQLALGQTTTQFWQPRHGPAALGGAQAAAFGA